MIEQPHIAIERIISALEERYSMRAAVEFLPIGLDSAAWAYRVQTEGDTYFLKIRKEIPNPAGILLPRTLQEQGIEQVIAPISSSKGNAWEAVNDFFFILYPFVAGRQAWDIGMSGAHWIEFGSILKRLHTMKLSPALSGQIRRETFVPKWLSWATETHAHMRAFEPKDPLQKELAEFWLENYATISIILQRTETLAKDMQKTHLDFVLCHADIHTANVLITEDDRLFIVDWDETIIAPKERDLMFVLARARTEEVDLFFKGYGETEFDALALAYYRYDWCVEDIGSFAAEVFANGEAGLETKRESVWWFKYLFSPGSSVQAALSTEVKVNSE